MAEGWRLWRSVWRPRDPVISASRDGALISALIYGVAFAVALMAVESLVLLAFGQQIGAGLLFSFADIIGFTLVWAALVFLASKLFIRAGRLDFETTWKAMLYVVASISIVSWIPFVGMFFAFWAIWATADAVGKAHDLEGSFGLAWMTVSIGLILFVANVTWQGWMLGEFPFRS